MSFLYIYIYNFFFFWIGSLEISLTNNRRQVDYILCTHVLNKAKSFLQPSHKIFNMFILELSRKRHNLRKY